MRKTATVLLLVLLATGCATAATPKAGATKPSPAKKTTIPEKSAPAPVTEKSVKFNDITVTLAVDKAEFSRNETNVFHLRVSNSGNQIALTYTSSQAYDFTITDTQNRQVWRWSEGKQFLTVMRDEVLTPGEKLESSEAVRLESLPAGTYTLTGMSWASELRDVPVSLTITILE